MTDETPRPELVAEAHDESGERRPLVRVRLEQNGEDVLIVLLGERERVVYARLTPDRGLVPVADWADLEPLGLVPAGEVRWRPEGGPDSYYRLHVGAEGTLELVGSVPATYLEQFLLGLQRDGTALAYAHDGLGLATDEDDQLVVYGE